MKKMQLACAALLTVGVCGVCCGASSIRVTDDASLQGVQEKIRQELQKNTPGPVVVELAAGTYHLAKPLIFGEADSGSAEKPVIFRAEPGAKVTITGGREVHGLEPLTDPVMLARLPEESRGKVFTADLKSQGIENLGAITVRGFGIGMNDVWEADLYYGGEAMNVSRWPKNGFRKALAKDGDTKVVMDFDDRSERWKDEVDPWIMAYWKYDWAEIYEPIVGWGEKTDEIIRSEKIKPVYGISPEETRCYVSNLFSEISEPRDYVIDRKNLKLYFMPPYEGGTITIPLAESIFIFDKAHHISVEGLTMEYTRDTVVKLNDTYNVSIIGCILHHAGKSGVVGFGHDNSIVGCDIYSVGASGIVLEGGDRVTLTPGNNVMDNNHIHHYSKRIRTTTCGIFTSGCGNVLSHNLIHHAPNMAVSTRGNNHIIEYNEIHNVMQESGDGGAYYIGRDWTWRGNAIRYNYFHHIKSDVGFGGISIYLDDQCSGAVITGNLFEKCNWAILIGGGCDCIVENNVFISCTKGVEIDGRGLTWQAPGTDDFKTLEKRFKAMPVDSPVWKQAYPMLAGQLEDNPGVPKRNVCQRNISTGGTWNNVWGNIQAHQTIENNVIHDEVNSWITLEKNELFQPVKLSFNDATAVEKSGFKPLPLEKMGLYKDAKRATWPVERMVDPVGL